MISVCPGETGKPSKKAKDIGIEARISRFNSDWQNMQSADI